MNQIELEQEMADGGRAKALRRFKENEDAASAHTNPYAQALYRRYILPVRDAIKLYVGTKKRGVAAKNKGLLAQEDPLSLAFLTLRGLMDSCMTEEEVTLTSQAVTLGRTVYGEVLLRHFEEVNDELYHTLVQDLERRLTKSERHRMAVFMSSAEKDGIVLPRWDTATKADVGLLLIGIAADMGFVRIVPVRKRKKTVNIVVLEDSAREVIEQIKGFVAGMMPQVMPCVEPPKDWVAPNDGGWHSSAMRRINPTMIRGRSHVDPEDVPPLVLEALNVMQRTKWRVNERVLEVAQIAYEKFDVQDILVSDRRNEAPDLPLWMQDNPDLKVADMTAEQAVEFKEWCAEKREWYTETKIRGSKAGRSSEALATAERFKGRPLWFVYTADYRGRFYASARGISPQGNDLSKALLEFDGPGWAITDHEAMDWFLIAGANRWGEDKIPLEDRRKWSLQNADLICRIAQDPISNRDWCQADAPFGFLAWAFEFAELRANPQTFRTRIPLGQDGSCNGIQHYSGMLRDPVGGAAVNLLPDTDQHDIYGDVAGATAVHVRRGLEDDPLNEMARRWAEHALSRGLVKRSVMTLPYGSTRFSSAEFILKEYLAKKQAPEFDKREYNAAATWLSWRVWDGIGDVVHLAREAMEWLQNASDALTGPIDGKIPMSLDWRSPSGFRVRQTYPAKTVLRVRSRISGDRRVAIDLRLAGDEGSPRNHRNGIAPNFVHSCDAAHMHFFLRRAAQEGLEGALALVHDDYGAPAPLVAKLHRILREEFVGMYTRTDPLLEFAQQHGEFRCRIRPTQGDLDLNQVLNSRYFFC